MQDNHPYSVYYYILGVTIVPLSIFVLYLEKIMLNFDVELDASGLNCPLPVLKARKALSAMQAGQRLLLIATDTGAEQDIPAFSKMTGNPLIETSSEGEKLYFVLEKGEA